MKLRFLLPAMFGLIGTAFPQQSPPKFGTVAPADIQSRAYAPDTTAEAVILDDFGETFLEEDEHRGYRVAYRRLTHIKILKKSGYSWASVSVPMYRAGTNQQETIREVRGRTYNANPGGGATTVDLTEKEVFEENLGDGWFAAKFTLPDVREGSVIEYSYVVLSDFVFRLNDWAFQHEIPVRRSEHHLALSPNFQYRVIFNGPVALSLDRSSPGLNGGIRYEWAMDNVPPLREEPYMTALNDYRARIRFELTGTTLPGQGPRSYSKTWEDLDKTLLTEAEFGQALNRTGFLKDLGQQLKTGYPDTLARLTAAHDLVKTLMTWNGKHTIWAGSALKTAYERKTGSAAEINLLLVGLLREAGLDAQPVVLSTRRHGLVPQNYPLLTWFNHVVALVTAGGRDVLLDATSPLLAADMLPAECLNGTGRLIHLRRPRWVSLAPRQRQVTVHTLALTLKPDGSLSGTAETSHSGYAGLQRRTEVFTKGVSAFLQKDLPRAYPSCTLSLPAVDNADSVGKSLVTRCTLESTELVQTAGNRLYLTPLLSTARRENPFKSPKRAFPVDFGAALEETSLISFAVPEGYVVEELPKSLGIALPNDGGRYTFSVLQSLTDNKLRVTSRLVLRKTVFTPDEYGALREFFDKIVAKQAEQVVLKKQ
jgi:hypothetical protein